MIDWITRTFLRKLTLTVCLLVLATTALVGVVASNVARTHLTEELASNLAAQAGLLILQMDRDHFRGERTAELDRWADSFGERTGARVTLTNVEGEVLGDSQVPREGLSGLEDHSRRPEIVQALSGGLGTAVRYSHTVGIDFLYVALSVQGGELPLGTLRLAMPLSDVNAKIARLRTAVIAASLICLLAALPLSILVSRSIHHPMARLAEAADRISRGDFSARADVRSKDELGRLGEVLNSLAERVAAMVGELSADKAQLEATLDNMVEAVAVVDRYGDIRELNYVMERLFSVETGSVRGKPLREAFGHDRLWELVSGALQGGEPRQDEVSLSVPEERLFEAAANPIMREGRADGAVLVLHDITRLRRLEEVRKEFVANVSHELRTPLAHVKASAETLRRGGIDDPDHRMEFVDTIEGHADRMARLVDELLDLAAIESGRRELRPEKVALSDAAEESMASLRHTAAHRNVAMECSIDPELRVSADRAALRQVFQNLLDNAVKYNRDNGKVEILARAADGKAEVSIADTGIGVPDKDLPRLFERFYRVDKARSRELGGTGLGLSIVKHLIEARGGRIWAESSEGKGSTFRFTVPLA